jgi:hypothetical protein
MYSPPPHALSSHVPAHQIKEGKNEGFLMVYAVVLKSAFGMYVPAHKNNIVESRGFTYRSDWQRTVFVH